MLTIPAEIQALYKRDSVRKNFRVHFPNGELPDITNANIVQESVTFTESLCSQEVLKFGLTEASCIEFETVGIGNMFGMTIQCYDEIDTSSLTAAQLTAIQADPGDGVLVLEADSDLGYGYYQITLGVFYVDKCPRNHGAMTHRQVTAYSLSLSSLDVKTALGLPASMIFPTVQVSEEAIKAMVDPSILVEGAPTSSTGVVPTAFQLFASDGRVYTFTINSRAAYGQYAINAITVGRFDFGLLSLDYDPAAYYAQGVSAAAALDAAGLDLTYNRAQKKIYQSNLDALLAVAPFLFYPCACDLIYSNSSAANYYGFENFNRVEPGKLFPVPDTRSDAGFNLPATSAFYAAAGRVVYAGLPTAGTGYLQYYSAQSGSDSVSYQFLAFDMCAVGSPTLRRFTLPSYSNPITINGDTTGAVRCLGRYAFLFDNLPLYSYSENNTRELLNGYLEAHGLFAKADRRGAFEEIALSPADPIQVSPGNYEDAWWDEYDVNPIGSVLVYYRDASDGDAKATVSIGDGASIYDMTDNEMLKSLSASDLDSVSTLLAGDFAANAENVGFTPVDLTMQGWPWVEAGDPLQITAEDGTVVNTYAMRVQISGIQHLTALIESTGGEIIDVEEGDL